MHEHISYQAEYARRARAEGPPIGFVADVDDEPDEPEIVRSAAIERPRERMVAFGPAALSNVELVALLLGGGRSQQRALALLQQVGGISGLLRCVPGELLAAPGVGEASATAVCAAVELARRIGQLEMPFESPIQGPEDVRRYLRASLRGRPQEVFVVLGLDARQRVRLVREVAIGAQGHVEVHPREVFRPLVRAGSHSVILVHNHPDGELRPSPADLRLTQRLSQLGDLLGIPVLDHLIVGDDGMTSFVGLGLLAGAGDEPDERG
jgi:DNA repair protein RadC